MADLGSTPSTYSTTSVSDKTVKNTLLSRGFKLTPDSYTTVDELIKATREDVMPELIQIYGDQGLTGFLKLTGAVNSGGSSDQIDWWEAGRRHRAYTLTDNFTSGSTGASVTVTDATFIANVQKNDVVMEASTGVRFIVQSGGATTSTSSPSNAVLVKMDNTAIVDADLTDGANNCVMLVIGNIYAQGTNQPTGFTDPGIKRYTNPYMIVKDRYEVNGSQATNVGYVNLGGGDYRWFMHGEGEARARFEDKRELMMLFGEKRGGTAGTALDNAMAGSEGYFSAIEDRGIVVQNASSNPLDSFSEFDDIILELDKQGAPSEYAMYVNRKQDLAIDDMLASGIATQVTAGLPGQFGAFQNNADMAVQLGFKSFTRGGYTFHKHDWRLLNDPTMLGAATNNFLQGCMVPLRTVNDARSGASVPALSMHYKEANGYSREMEHWVTGGGVLGHTNNGDAGTDQAVFHYRSEIALCVRAANQHVMIKG
jgi:hypothetical protein